MTVEPLDAAVVTSALRHALPMSTERLVLRLFAPSDLDAFRAWRHHPDTVRFLWRPPLTEDELIERVTATPVIAQDGDAFAIGIEHDGVLVGETVVKLTSLAGRQTEIGWILTPAARGRGIATEAAAATLDLAIAIGGHRIVAVIDHENQASAAVARRLGMRKEAVLIDDGVNLATGEYGSTEIWAMLASERTPITAGT